MRDTLYGCALAGGLAVLGLCGCRSVEGRYVDPTRLTHGQDVGGAPIIVERPRWLMVTHKEQQLALLAEKKVVDEKTEKTTTTHEVLDVSQVQGIGAQVLTRKTVETQVLSMGEMYAIDMLRPFAGTSNHSLEWNDEKSHPKKLTTNTDDKTLDTVLTNLEKIKDFLPSSRDAAPPAYKDAGTVVVSERVARIELYDLYDLAKGVVRAVWVQEPGTGPQCAPPCPMPAAGPCPPPPCPPRAR